MELEAAKMIGAGLAAIALAGAFLSQPQELDLHRQSTQCTRQSKNFS